MAEFQDLPEETQEGIIRGIEDVEAGRYKVIHVEEPKLPTLAYMKDAYKDRRVFVAQVLDEDEPSEEVLEEEFDEFIESIRAKAWLEGLEFAKNLKGQES